MAQHSWHSTPGTQHTWHTAHLAHSTLGTAHLAQHIWHSTLGTARASLSGLMGENLSNCHRAHRLPSSFGLYRRIGESITDCGVDECLTSCPPLLGQDDVGMSRVCMSVCHWVVATNVSCIQSSNFPNFATLQFGDGASCPPASASIFVYPHLWWRMLYSCKWIVAILYVKIHLL